MSGFSLYQHHFIDSSYLVVSKIIINNNNASIYSAVFMARPLLVFTQFIWWMQPECQAATNPQTKPTDMGCESACNGAAIIYTHRHHLLILLSPNADTHILSSHRG